MSAAGPRCAPAVRLGGGFRAVERPAAVRVSRAGFPRTSTPETMLRWKRPGGAGIGLRKEIAGVEQGLRAEIAGVKEQMRTRFDVAAESLRHDIQLAAEAVAVLAERDRE